MVKIPPSNAGGTGLIPGWKSKGPQLRGMAIFFFFKTELAERRAKDDTPRNCESFQKM